MTQVQSIDLFFPPMVKLIQIYGIPVPKCKYMSWEKWKACTWGTFFATLLTTQELLVPFVLHRGKKPQPSNELLFIYHSHVNGLAGTTPLPGLLAKLQTTQITFFSFLSPSFTQYIFFEVFTLSGFLIIS